MEVADWKRVEAREVPPRQGRPIVGFDLGAERSMECSLLCLSQWAGLEALAVMPGIPGIEPSVNVKTVCRVACIAGSMSPATCALTRGDGYHVP